MNIIEIGKDKTKQPLDILDAETWFCPKCKAKYDYEVVRSRELIYCPKCYPRA